MKRTKRVLGLALAAVMCVGLLAGCGGNPSSSDTADDASGAETSEKVLNIATIGETTTLPIMSSLKSLIFQAFSNLLPHINRAKSDEQS